MSKDFEQHYQDVCAGYYAQQAAATRERLVKVDTKDLPAELAKAEAQQNFHHEAEANDDIVRLLVPHMQTAATQNIVIIKEVMAFRKTLLVERMAQLRAIIDTSTMELETAAHLVERLSPYLLTPEENQQ